ncbi:ATP-NAD kinase-like domain-containing protein [Amylocarpus encephaloides]|uniref:ATP-NAD kinase-like domain-containing protein n=1 Tax=Amylocarpus encephaloides TaxID=45428 RepID=A0A9P7YCM4_9HELO|nr:ATP-NAD kinase-like domain-containing protein [Amylocarpus encephaloides]
MASTEAPPNQTATGNNSDPVEGHASFFDGILTIGSVTLPDGTNSPVHIRGEDVIFATGRVQEKGGSGYTIFSLAPIDPTPEKPFSLRTTKCATLPENFLVQHQINGLPSHLDPARNICVLVSTLSGTGLGVSFENVLATILEGIGLPESSYNVVRTESTESVRNFARMDLLVGANEGHQQTVVMLSGDGGMADIINGLLQDAERTSEYMPPILSLLPLGTGNALFHSMHRAFQLPSMYTQALRTLIKGIPKPLPTFRVRFSSGARLITDEGQKATPLPKNTLYGAVVASYGLHATLVADSDTKEYRTHGDKRFGLVAKDLLFPDDKAPPHAYEAELTLSSEGHTHKLAATTHGYILGTLASNLEKTFTISPESKPLDGSLRVVRFGAFSGEETMEIMKAAYQDGAHVKMDNVEYQALDSFKVKFLEKGDSWQWRRCCIDGLMVGVEVDGWMDVSMVEKGAHAVEIVAPG